MFSFATQVIGAAYAAFMMGNIGHAQPLPLCSRQYVVQAGDVCDVISAAQNVSTFQLAHVNGAINNDCSNLFVGETLCLGIVGQDCTTVRTVQAGESCTSIAIASGSTFDTVRANNPNVDTGCTNIYPGEVLCTATTLIPYTGL